MPILSVDSLVKSYGRRTVVNGVSLDVEAGEIVGLLGPNGAGKTTTFRMICGMVRPDRGIVFLGGEEVTNWPMYLRARDGGMGYLPQQTSVFGKLSAEKNLYGVMQLLGFSRKRQRERCDELLDQFQISHIRKTKADRLSGGEKRRLELARCLVSDPKIIMLDEPFAGVDPVTVQNIQGIIRGLANQGIAILITDHAAREILQTTDRTYVVSEGQILVNGSAEEIVRHPEVRAKYLGDIEFTRQESRSEKTVAEPTTDSENDMETKFQLKPRILPIKPTENSAELEPASVSANDPANLEITFEETHSGARRAKLRRTDLD